MKRNAFVLITLGLIVLAACTHRREWTTHDVTLSTAPAGARCSFERAGITTQPDEQTPFDITLTNIPADITVRFALYGYHPSTTTVTGRFRGTIFMVLAPDERIPRQALRR